MIAPSAAWLESELRVELHHHSVLNVDAALPNGSSSDVSCVMSHDHTDHSSLRDVVQLSCHSAHPGLAVLM